MENTFFDKRPEAFQFHPDLVDCLRVGKAVQRLYCSISAKQGNVLTCGTRKDPWASQCLPVIDLGFIHFAVQDLTL